MLHGGYHIEAVPTSPATFAATISGDLIDTAVYPFDFGSRQNGETSLFTGRADWTITGGVVPMPLSFTTAFEIRNQLVDRPGSPAMVIENIETHRAIAGVQTANLHDNGVLMVVHTVIVHVDAHGVLCL